MVMRAFLAGRSIRMRETAAFLSLVFRYSRTLMSSASMPAKVGRMDFLSHGPGPLVAYRHVHMARRLADAVAATFGARGGALEGGTLLDMDGLDLQFLDVRTIVVFGVGDGRLQHLPDDSCSFFLREVQDVQRLIDLLAANQVSDQTTLVDRQTDTPQDGMCFRHGRLLTS